MAVRARSHEADELIARLEKEHQDGYPMVEDLKTQLIAWQQGQVGAQDAFCATVARYLELEWGHMRTEEDLLMPIAERTLTADDWVAINTAFRENDNPLFGIKPKEEAELLYQRILSLAPAPIGYGPAR